MFASIFLLLLIAWVFSSLSLLLLTMNHFFRSLICYCCWLPCCCCCYCCVLFRPTGFWIVACLLLLCSAVVTVDSMLVCSLLLRDVDCRSSCMLYCSLWRAGIVIVNCSVSSMIAVCWFVQRNWYVHCWSANWINPIAVVCCAMLIIVYVLLFL